MQESEFYIVFDLVAATVHVSWRSKTWVVTCAIIETGSIIVSAIQVPLVLAIRISNLQNWKQVYEDNENIWRASE